MTKILCIANQKGGVAKTTTATALASGLRLAGARVLLVDTDPQGNCSDTYGATIEGQATLYDLLVENEPAANCIQSTPAGDIIPSDPQLANADMKIVATGKEFRLKKALSPISALYDFIIIDTPPSLGVLLINALTAATSIIIPITADRYSLQGLSQLKRTIGDVKEFTNPNLTIGGLLVCKFHARTNLSKEVLDVLPSVADMLDSKIFETTIRESTAVKEAQVNKQSVFSYSPNCTTAQDYAAFIKEFLKEG